LVTHEEIEYNIQKAIMFHLLGMKEDGIKIPKPKTEALSILLPNVA